MNTTTVNGITIPQGTTVQPDVWSLHYNSEHWGPTDPQQFDPDRLVVNKVYISCKNSLHHRHIKSYYIFISLIPLNNVKCYGVKNKFMLSDVLCRSMDLSATCQQSVYLC